DHGVGGCEVEPGSACLEADEKDRHLAVLEALHRRAAVAGVAGDLHIGNITLEQLFLDQRQHRGELREHQYTAAFDHQLLQHLQQAVQLARAAAASNTCGFAL